MWKNRYKLMGVISIIIMFMLCGIARILSADANSLKIKNAYREKLKPQAKTEEPCRGIDTENEYTVNEEFTSHLPIVILDLPDGAPPISLEREKGTGNFIPIQGVEPYVNGTLSIINTGEENHINDKPEIVSNITIKRRGNSSMLYDKAQWTVKLLTESGEKNDIDLLGMGMEHEWILNGSLADKSMLRNYLSYSIASEFMEFTPDARYCEVLIRENSELTYGGVYLLAETIKVGPDRVNIHKFKPNQLMNSYLVRRDRIDSQGIMLDTYGRLNGFSSEYIGLEYPSKTLVTEDMIQYVSKDISEIERVLYAENSKIFELYQEVIDVDSFIDYFLFNEFFGSYDAGNFSTYAYKDMGGKLHMGPVWDLDSAMDNYYLEPLSEDDLAFQTKPWFDRLCMDKEFIKKLASRYANLRRGILSDEHIAEKIDEIVAYLGDAIEREWSRWGDTYTHEEGYHNLWLQDYETEEGIVLHRNAHRYQDEIYRLKSALASHASYIYDQIRIMERSAVFDTGFIRWRGWALLVVVFLFFVPAIKVVRRK